MSGLQQLFAEYGLPVSKGYAAETPKQAVEAAEQIRGHLWVVKAQVHAGERGKAGGVSWSRPRTRSASSRSTGSGATW